MIFQDKKININFSDVDIENIIWLAGVNILPRELIVFDELDSYGKYLLPLEYIQTIISGLSKIEQFESLPFELGISLRKLKKILIISVKNRTEIIVVGD